MEAFQHSGEAKTKAFLNDIEKLNVKLTCNCGGVEIVSASAVRPNQATATRRVLENGQPDCGEPVDARSLERSRIIKEPMNA